MRSAISTIAAVAAGLFASTVSAQGQVAIYWGQGAYQKELSVVCEDPSVDIVNIAFINGFPKDRNTYPDANFGNACGGYNFPNPDGTASKFLGKCDLINKGIKTCKANGKKVLLSLGGGYPTDYYLASKDAASWLAEVLVGSFGPKTSDKYPRPFGDDVAVDGFDLDIESSTAVGDQKFQYYGDLVNYIKARNPSMLISSAPQCIVPDAHLDKAIAEAPFDYIFVQFYNTDACSAARGLKDLVAGTANTGFTWNAWTKQLQTYSANKNVKLFLGLPAGTNGASEGYYLTQTAANRLIKDIKDTPLFGGVMLWEATVSQNNTRFDQPYSQWIKYSLQGTFEQNYHPVVSSTIRSSSTLVSSTKSSTPVSSQTSTPASSKVTSTPASSKATSTPASSKATSTPASSKVTSTPASSKAASTPASSKATSTPASSKVTSTPASSKATSTPASSKATSTPVSSNASSVPSSSKSSSVVQSSTAQFSSTPVVASSTPVATSSTVYPTSSSATVESSIHYSDYFSTASIPAVESSLSYSDYFSTALPSDYSASSTPEPSTVYPEDVSSTAILSSSSAYVTSSVSEHSSVYETSSVPADVSSSASSSYETSSTPEVTSSASESSVYETSSVPEVTSSASEYSSTASGVYETSSVPEVTSSASEYSSTYSVSSSTSDYEASSSTPVDASSTPCTTSTESYKTPEASSSASEYSYSASSKVPEVSSSYSEYSAESTKTPEASTGAYSASSAPASSTPCTTSTGLYPTSSKTPEASSATEYSYYSASSKVPEVSSKASEYPSEYPSSYATESSKTSEASSKSPIDYPTDYPVESTKTPEASSATDYSIYSTATPSVTKPAQSTTTVVTTTYLDTCSTGLTTKTTVITKTVCTGCAKPSGKPEPEYPTDWTTSVYISKTLTVTITKPIHPATDVPAYPTGISSEYPVAPKPSSPAEYPVDKENVPTYGTPASSVPHEATKPSSVPAYPEVPVPSHKTSSAPAVYPTASAPAYPTDATVTISSYITLTKVATPVHTPAAYTPVAHQGYPVSNGTVPAGTGAIKPSSTGSYPVKPSSYVPPEFTGAGGRLSVGMTGFVAVVAWLVL